MVRIAASAKTYSGPEITHIKGPEGFLNIILGKKVYNLIGSLVESVLI